MSFDWNEYFLLAKKLSEETNNFGSREARERSAISRGYYSAIIQARTKICSINGEKAQRRNTHKWTIDRYKSNNSPLAKSIGSRLERLKKRREKADYDNNIKNLESELKSALLETERLIKDIDAFPR